MEVGLQAFAATPSSPLLNPSSKNPVLPSHRGLCCPATGACPLAPMHHGPSFPTMFQLPRFWTFSPVQPPTHLVTPSQFQRLSTAFLKNQWHLHLSALNFLYTPESAPVWRYIYSFVVSLSPQVDPEPFAARHHISFTFLASAEAHFPATVGAQ